MALSLCLHRDEETKRLEAKDVLFALKKAYGIIIPGNLRLMEKVEIGLGVIVSR